METIEGDLCVGKMVCSPFLKGRRKIHADLGDGLGLATMSLKILGELCEGLDIFSRCGKEQALFQQVHEDGDVIMTAPVAGFIHTDGVDIRHVHGLTGFGDIMVDHPPESLVGLPNQLGDCPYGHLPDHRNDQCLKEQRETRSFPRPGTGTR